MFQPNLNLKVATIKCSVCNQVMGTLKKRQITQEDRDKYSDMVNCDGGHKATVLVIQEEQN